MERRMLRITLRDKWTNERIRQETKVRDWVKEALKRKLQWADKIRKMEDSRWARATTVWIPYGTAGHKEDQEQDGEIKCRK